MDPFTASLIARGTLSALQLFKGATSNPVRPKMEVPGSVQEATNNARIQANATQRPGREQANQEIFNNTSNAIANTQNASTSSSNVLSMVGRLTGQQNNALRQQDQLDANFKLQAQNNLTNQLNNQGRWENQSWQWNKAQKFNEEALMKNNLLGSGISNLYSGLNDFASADLMKKQIEAFKTNQNNIGNYNPMFSALGLAGSLNHLRNFSFPSNGLASGYPSIMR